MLGALPSLKEGCTGRISICNTFWGERSSSILLTLIFDEHTWKVVQGVRLLSKETDRGFLPQPRFHV